MRLGERKESRRSKGDISSNPDTPIGSAWDKTSRRNECECVIELVDSNSNLVDRNTESEDGLTVWVTG